MSLRCLFIVQGEGRGHLTQAMALQQLLNEAGHRVAGVVVGKSKSQPVPDFFEVAFDGSVTFVDSPSFVSDGDDRSVRPWATVLHEMKRAPVFWRGLRGIHRSVERHEPDVIVNFFEPLVGVYSAVYRPTVPVVAIGHQYMFLHPTYRFPPGRPLQQWAAGAIAQVAAWGAARRLALSLYPASNRPRQNLSVLPPLLRANIGRYVSAQRESFFLIYLLNSGYADDVVRWHKKNPGVRLHCFWDRSNTRSVLRYDETLTFHQLDDEKFLRLMARARGIVCTAGFESVAEAMYFGTPVQAVPVDGHYEQLCNAVDAVRAGAGIRSSDFDVGRLKEFLPEYVDEAADFRDWVHTSRSRVIREIEAAALDEECPARVSSVSADPTMLETA